MNNIYKRIASIIDQWAYLKGNKDSEIFVSIDCFGDVYIVINGNKNRIGNTYQIDGCTKEEEDRLVETCLDLYIGGSFNE